MKSLHDLYLTTRSALKTAGIDIPDLEARLMLKQVLSVSDADIISGISITVTPGQDTQLGNYISRRLGGEPLTRIFGEREFWGLPFTVTPDVLDPRADTETLVSAALGLFSQNQPGRILDLGTGTGCIVITLLHEWKHTQGVAVDISPAALAVARRNAERNHVDARLSFLESNWLDSVTGTFDLIVSNPPYIRSKDIESLSIEVKNHDPILALDGGAGGIEPYKKILTEIKSHLNPGGKCLFEIGKNQLSDITRLVEESDLYVRESYRDLAGIPRVVEISTGEN